MIKAPKKLIEVALPLDDINAAASREKSIRHGHPSTLHLWWARRPLAAARAVLFAQLVNDPGGERGWGRYPGQTKEDAQCERERLFAILRDLVTWENTTNEVVLEKARAEIRKSWRETCDMNKGQPGFDPDKLPAFHDPFAGGGAIPLEAQRLGLEAHASDLNPVAVLINKAMIEIPPKFAGRPPVSLGKKDEKDGKKSLGLKREWKAAQGLAEDVRYYGQWMRDEAFKRIGPLYPPVKAVQNADATWRHATPAELQAPGSAPHDLIVIAWIWARTVKSPNPAFRHVDVPLIKSFVLSSKKGKEAWLQPVVEGDTYRFEVRHGSTPEAAKEGTKLSRGANFQCVLSGSPIEAKYIRSEAQAGRMGQKLIAIVCENSGRQGRVYLPACDKHERIAKSAEPAWKPTQRVPTPCHDVDRLPMYGMPTWGDAFTDRQLVALTTFSDLVSEARERVIADAKAAGWVDDGVSLENGGVGATTYGDALAVYLGLGVSRLADIQNALCRWENTKTQVRNLFTRQAIAMMWDFAETGLFSGAAGDYGVSLESICRCIRTWRISGIPGSAVLADAAEQTLSRTKVVSSDPPYYDNVGYADLSDFFYVWLRRVLRAYMPRLFATIVVPKAEELIASPYRHDGGRDAAEEFFLDGMTKAMHNLAENAHGAFPVTIYYAFKQDANTASTGWETFLEAVVVAGFAVTGTCR